MHIILNNVLPTIVFLNEFFYSNINRVPSYQRKKKATKAKNRRSNWSWNLNPLYVNRLQYKVNENTNRLNTETGREKNCWSSKIQSSERRQVVTNLILIKLLWHQNINEYKFTVRATKLTKKKPWWQYHHIHY